MPILKNAFYLALTTQIFFACNNTGNKEVLLNSIYTEAGKNKAEILTAFNHYNNDTARQNALIYILKNLRGRYHASGPIVDSMHTLLDIFKSLDDQGRINFSFSYDSIIASHPNAFKANQEQIPDLTDIKAETLIQHIDASFKSLQYPWAINIKRDEFYNFILPIKFLNEKPDSWKSIIQARLKEITDTMSQKDPYSACIAINEYLKQRFYITKNIYPYHLNFSELNMVRSGLCFYATQYTACIMNALGIPVAIDFTPYWGNKNAGHEWNVLYYQDKFYNFIGSESNPGADKIFFTRSGWLRRKRPKIFRRVFDNAQALIMPNLPIDSMPELFKNALFMDVTNQYVPTTDVKVKLHPRPNGSAVVYAAVFNENKWVATDLTVAGNLFGTATFKDLGTDICYLPCYYKSEKLQPAGLPFIIHFNGSVVFITPDTTLKEKIVIHKKYPEDKTNLIIKGENYELFYWNNDWISLGKQKAPADSLVYDNVPQNALFWVRNLDKGMQERIFMYENNNQLWW